MYMNLRQDSLLRTLTPSYFNKGPDTKTSKGLFVKFTNCFNLGERLEISD